MQKQITVLFLILSMHACAMPKYLEQLPEESLTRQFYMEQKENTTDAKLLKDLQNVDDAIERLIEGKHKADDENKHSVKDALTLTGEKVKFGLSACLIALSAQIIVNSKVKNHLIKTMQYLPLQEEKFLLNLLENELKIDTSTMQEDQELFVRLLKNEIEK